MRDWRSFRAQLRAWWYSPTADDLRAAYHDTRRAPGWALLALIAVLWPASGFSLLPIGAAAVAWLLVMLATRFVWSWYARRRIRRFARPLIGILAFLALALEAGLWGWLLAIGLWFVGMGLSDTVRARRRIIAWVLRMVARSARVDPAGLHVTDQAWDRLTPLFLEVEHSGLAAEDPAVRERVTQAVRWALRHAGPYSVEWPPGLPVFHIKATNPLPRKLPDGDWGQLPGIPVGVTDEETADDTYSMIDGATGQVLQSHHIKMVKPVKEKHLLVVGASGGGKTNFTRGFIARGLVGGFWPGGVFIFDGKASADYIVFEGREGIHCVARDPDEWTANLDPVDMMMRDRYAQDAEYHRGNREKPHFPRFLVVLDEVQEIRAELGSEFDKYLQRWARQVRAANGRLLVATQRPDAKDAVPGAVKELLEYVFVLGYVGPVGAREALGNDWRFAVDEYGAETVPGRGVAKIDGVLLRLQTIQLDLPREKPELEPLYPRKLAQIGAGDSGGRGGQEDRPLPENVARWAPRPTPPPEEEQPAPQAEPQRPETPVADVDPDAPTPPYGIPRIGLASAPPDESDGGSGGSGEARPRRRRTV